MAAAAAAAAAAAGAVADSLVGLAAVGVVAGDSLVYAGCVGGPRRSLGCCFCCCCLCVCGAVCVCTRVRESKE